MGINRAQRLLYEAINKYFMDLSDTKISIGYADLEDAFLEEELTNGKNDSFVIRVDKKTMMMAPEKALLGGIVHELAHIYDHKRIGNNRAIKETRRYRNSKRQRYLDERNADLETIIRGAGEELLKFYEHKERRGYEMEEDHGLSITEIKQIISRSYNKKSRLSA